MMVISEDPHLLPGVGGGATTSSYTTWNSRLGFESSNRLCHHCGDSIWNNTNLSWNVFCLCIPNSDDYFFSKKHALVVEIH